MNIKKSDKPTQPQQSIASKKSLYSTPALRVFGSVKHLTKGNNGTKADGQSANPRP